jgi:hypothetical protein
MALLHGKHTLTGSKQWEVGGGLSSQSSVSPFLKFVRWAMPFFLDSGLGMHLRVSHKATTWQFMGVRSCQQQCNRADLQGLGWDMQYLWQVCSHLPSHPYQFQGSDVQWISIVCLIFSGIGAGFKLFNGAWLHVMRSPVAWHDRTPTGRIISRLSKGKCKHFVRDPKLNFRLF